MNVLTSILAIGGTAGVGYILYTLFSGGGGEIAKKLQAMFQKKKLEEIDEIEKKQTDVAKKVLESEKVAEETKQKIKEIKKEYNKKIVKTLQEENLEDMLVGDDELWEG
jgi:phosphomannomutase